MKRGDVHAMQSGDVVFVSEEEQLRGALAHFRLHGICDVLLQEHVEGRVVKFYGVGQGDYFKAFLADTGDEISAQVQKLSKIAARHTCFSAGDWRIIRTRSRYFWIACTR